MHMHIASASFASGWNCVRERGCRDSDVLEFAGGSETELLRRGLRLGNYIAAGRYITFLRNLHIIRMHSRGKYMEYI